MITITKSALVALLARVAPVIGKSTLPVLAGTRLSVVDGRLQAEATNLDQWITTSEPCDVGMVVPEPIIVGAKRMQEIAQALPAAPVTLEPTDKGLVVKAGKGRFTLPTFPVSEWPEIERATMPITIALPAAALVDALARAARFVSTQESRPVLNGICLVSDADGVRLVATDSHRLLDWPMGEATGMAARGQWILPPAVATAAKTLGGESIALALGERMARFQGGQSSFTTRLIEGPYPNVKPLLGLEPTSTIRVDRSALAAAVKRVAAFEHNGVRAVDFAIAGNTITLTDAGSDAGSGYDEVACRAEGADVQVRYDADLLLTALEHATAGGSEIRLAIVGAERPTYCEGETAEDAGRRALVMPLRRNAA